MLERKSKQDSTAIAPGTKLAGRRLASYSVDTAPHATGIVLRLDDTHRMSAVHMHQIVYHMRHMIGVTSTTIRGQQIYVFFDPDEATARQVKNYLCAAVFPFGLHWCKAVKAAYTFFCDGIDDDRAETSSYNVGCVNVPPIKYGDCV